MKKDTQIIILVGPKGSGKTTIGRLLQKHYICHFFEFDKEHLKKYKTRQNYVLHRSEAQRITRQRVIHSINNHIPAIFEIIKPNDTVKILARDYHIDFIEVFASKETILARVKKRNETKTENFVSSHQEVIGSLKKFLNHSRGNLKFTFSVNTDTDTFAAIINKFSSLLVSK